MAGKSRVQLKEEVVTVVNEETGEIVSSEKKVKSSRKISSPHYSMLLDNGVNQLTDLKGNELKVLLQLSKHTAYDKNTVSLTAKIRSDIALILGTSVQAVTNSISNLRKQRIIILEQQEAFLNPNLIWRGQTSERENVAKRWSEQHIKNDG